MSKGTAASFVATHFGHTFSDEALLKTALTHRSAGGRNNERLEFLGDAILNFVVADALYQRFPDAREGELTRLRARFVRGESLADVAREIKLGDLLSLGGGELKSGGRDRTSILADAFESLIGALYLDGGIEAARVFVVDPMLATGGSAVQAIQHLKNHGARRFTFVCLVAAPEGVRVLNDAHPEVPIVTATVDRQLNDHAYILPGLGDAGDRIFGTE